MEKLFLYFLFFSINLPPFYFISKTLTINRIILIFVFSYLIKKTINVVLNKKIKPTLTTFPKTVVFFLLIFIIQSLSILSASNVKQFINKYEISVFFIALVFVFSRIFKKEKINFFITLIIISFIPLLIFETFLFFFPNLIKQVILPFLHPTASSLITYNIERGRNFVESFNFFLIPLLIYKVYTENKLFKLLLLSFLIYLILFLSIVSNFRLYLLLVIINLLISSVYFKKSTAVRISFFLTIIVFATLMSGVRIFSKSNIIDRFLLENQTDIKTLSGRINFWKKSIEIGLSHPLLGVGLGNYPEYFSKEITSLRFSTINKNIMAGIIQVYDDPHNIFMSIFSETGFIGLLVFLMMFSYLIKLDFHFLLFKSSLQNKNLSTIKTSFIISFWSLILYSFINPSNSMRFYFLLIISRIIIDKLS